MKFELKEIKDAYKRLKTYIYYDNTDIILRRKLVEFETNLTKDFNSIFRGSEEPYQIGDELDIFKNDFGVPQSIDSKLQIFTDELNNFHYSSVFFDYFLNKIDANIYPKKYEKTEIADNFISNRRIEKEYPINRLTAFIDAPIEIHLLSVLWTINYGVQIDSKLEDNCIGNRLLLSKDKKTIVHGSGLFKPYFKQYQKWRDDSVNVAQELIKSERDVLFLNLDIKDYFHSVRIPNDLIYSDNKTHYKLAHNNLNRLFLKIHHIYTEKISIQYEQPYNFSNELERNEENELQEFILPIGLLSSFVLANDYLKDFDKRIVEKYKPAYYGRYVDDILLVLADPNPNSNNEELNEEFKFSFNDYKKRIKKKCNSKNNIHYKITFEEDTLNEIEKYIISNLSPLINLVDSPFSSNSSNSKGRVFKINGKKSLFCQSDKTLLYYFDSEESDMVINKLKRELEERTSEFRDLPSHDNSLGEFESSAYHLDYNGTEGKIKTLQDYKENRYGLTLFLSNQIFSSLNHERSISDKEKNQVLKFFKGSTCLEFYRLWERVFTYFLVNKEPKSYIDFYIHCAEQIDKIGIKDATIVFRLKNHYAPVEEHLISQNHLSVPKPDISRYDIFNWKSIYFSVFYCFELADLEHRSLLRSKIDLLIALEWNKDTPYFSNIIEASARDLHCYVAQVNTSQFGDTRLTQPTETARKDLLRLKGGTNDAILVSKLDIPKLREFQRKKFSVSNKTFKPLPPNFSIEEVLKRIKNKNIT